VFIHDPYSTAIIVKIIKGVTNATPRPGHLHRFRANLLLNHTIAEDAILRTPILKSSGTMFLNPVMQSKVDFLCVRQKGRYDAIPLFPGPSTFLTHTRNAYPGCILTGAAAFGVDGYWK